MSTKNFNVDGITWKIGPRCGIKRMSKKGNFYYGKPIGGATAASATRKILRCKKKLSKKKKLKKGKVIKKKKKIPKKPVWDLNSPLMQEIISIRNEPIKKKKIPKKPVWDLNSPLMQEIISIRNALD